MKILLKLLLLLLVTTSVVAKSPPPGIGSDLPANILLMLDVSSSMNGGASASPLSTPLDVAVDSKGNVFVSQIGHHLIKKFDNNGNFVKSWGGWGNANGKFKYALRIATDAGDNVYVTDYMNHRIQKFDNDGNFIRIFTATGRAGGLSRPDSLEIDKSTGNIYSSSRNIKVVMQNQEGNYLGEINNYTVSGRYRYPFGLSVHDGYLYIANSYYKSFTKYPKDLAGDTPAVLGVNKWSTSGWAWDVKVSDSGVYVANYNNNQMQKFSHDGTLIKSWGNVGVCAGNSCLYHPAGLSIGPDGNVFVNDRHNHAIKKFDTDGNFLSFIGGKTKLDVAKESIKWIVSNAELNKGANFGLMTWDSSARIVVDVKASGAQEIYNMVDGITANCPFPSCTDIGKAMLLAQRTVARLENWYPEAAKCQNTTLVVLTDGGLRDGHAYYGNLRAKELFTKKDIKTFVVSMLSAIPGQLRNLAEAGGTYSNDGDDSNDYSPVAAIHKQTIIDALLEFTRVSVDNNRSTFTKPVLKQESESEDYVYQSTFKYVKSHQWQGELKKYQLVKGVPEDEPVWDAAKKLNETSAVNRNIWTIASDFNVPTSINNFNSSNADKLKYLLWENAPVEPTTDDATKLINFVRGSDSYNEVSAADEKKNNLLGGERWKLGDIFHSELKVIGIPSAKSSNTNVNSEAYYRHNNAYNGRFLYGNSCGGYCAQRKKMVYVGSNDGLLHAFDASNGNELWAFLPPMMMTKMRTAISSKSSQSVSIYGVDGSPIVKDIYYQYKWRTVLISGLGLGGNGYFALDVTDPNNPSFLFAFSNDLVNSIVSYWDSTGHKTDRGYAGEEDFDYAYSKLGMATSTPQIILIPYEGKQKWVAVFGAGFNAGVNDTYGSSVYVIDLENQGKILKRVDIPDIPGNNIANSIPAPVVAITPDSTSIANYKGAMVYFADLEGSLWKLNLTNQGTMFDLAQLFKADSTFDNDRMESFQVTASIASDDKLWLYYGTGNQQKIQRISDSIENRIYGIKDSDFPQFKADKKAATISQLKDTTASGAACPTDADSGWYFKLDKNERITGQIAVNKETIFASRYIPNTVDLCKTGNASLSEHGYTCGNEKRETKLGAGIASGAVIFKDKVYLSITGEGSGVIKDGDKEIGERKKNLIVITPKADSEAKTITKGVVVSESWREIY